METTIVIHCEDEREILTHLSVIRKQVKRAFRKHLKNDPDYQNYPHFRLFDSNCYGDHEVIIADQDTDEYPNEPYNYEEKSQYLGK